MGHGMSRCVLPVRNPGLNRQDVGAPFCNDAKSRHGSSIGCCPLLQGGDIA
jgi:hypothetical protein